LLTPLSIRPRDIQLGPDGNLYIATEGASGGQASDGMVLRIEPVQ
jgi:glucose/arabinose dehydrogenase